MLTSIVILKLIAVLCWLRWVCTSAMPVDLETTDNLAVTVLENIVKKGGEWTIDGGY